MNNGRHFQNINRDNEKRRKRSIKQTQNVDAVNIITYTAHNEAQRWAYFREEAQGNISGKNADRFLGGFGQKKEKKKNLKEYTKLSQFVVCKTNLKPQNHKNIKYLHTCH